MTENWVQIKDKSQGTYNTNRQVKLKTSMLKSSLCGIITVPNTGTTAKPSN